MMRKINNRKVNERDIERVKLILGDMELSFHISEIGHFQMNCSKSHIVKKGDVCYEEVAEILEIEIEAGCLGEIEQLLNHIYTIGLKYVILVRSDDHTRNYVYSVAEAAQKKTTFRVTSRGDFRIVIGEEYYDCEHFAKYESSARSLFFGGDPRDSKGAVAINKYTSAKLKSNHFELITDRQFILKNALAEILDICGLHYKADRENMTQKYLHTNGKIVSTYLCSCPYSGGKQRIYIDGHENSETCVFCHEAADTVVLAYQFENENGVNQIYALEDDIECIYESFL